jgi:hypothetical protein
LVVRRREQVDRGVAEQELHARVALQGRDQRVLDGAPRGIGGVQDARQRMPAFAAEREAAVGRAVERHTQPVEQDRLHQLRAALREDRHRLVVAQAVARVLDVPGEQLRRVLVALEDDAALRPVGVRLLGSVGAGDDHDLEPGFG